MGIVNLTDDSFFAGSRVLSSEGSLNEELLLERTEKMLSEGASIIDLGACSTRPGSEPVPEYLELYRLKTALSILKDAFPSAAFSIDTFRSKVVENLYDSFGSFWVNDISSGEASPGMLPLVGSLGLTYIAMHMRGTPATMQSMTDYEDVAGEVLKYFEAFSARAEEAGIKDWILDPGFGFAKTAEQNYELLSRLGEFRCLGRPILVGLSRKSFIYKPLGISAEDALSATQVLNFAALQGGATLLRVHDVAEAVRTVKLFKALNIKN